MEKLKAKLNKQGGFTLIEMLIVVAIIAILIAISIPMVNAALENAREATDSANERAALGLAMVEVMGQGKLGGVAVADAEISAIYQISDSQGTLIPGADGSSVEAYGQGTAAGKVAARTGQVVKVTYTPNATTGTGFATAWVAGKTA